MKRLRLCCRPSLLAIVAVLPPMRAREFSGNEWSAASSLVRIHVSSPCTRQRDSAAPRVSGFSAAGRAYQDVLACTLTAP